MGACNKSFCRRMWIMPLAWTRHCRRCKDGEIHACPQGASGWTWRLKWAQVVGYTVQASLYWDAWVQVQKTWVSGSWLFTPHTPGFPEAKFELISRSKALTENVGLKEERMWDVGRLKWAGSPCRKWGSLGGVELGLSFPCPYLPSFPRNMRHYMMTTGHV